MRYLVAYACEIGGVTSFHNDICDSPTEWLRGTKDPYLGENDRRERYTPISFTPIELTPEEEDYWL